MIAVFTAMCCLSVGCGGSVGTSAEIETQAIFATPNVPESVDKPNDAAVSSDMWDNYKCAYSSNFDGKAYSYGNYPQVYSIKGKLHLSEGAQWGEWDKAFMVDFESVFIAERVELVERRIDSELYLELSDVDGKVLKTVPVQTLPLENFLEFHSGSPFSFWVEFINKPWENDISQKYHTITLFDNSNPDSPRSIGSISRSDNAPVASILNPTQHQTILDEPLVLSWKASDLDGDELTYRTWYSTNHGRNYTVLEYNTDSISYEFKRHMTDSTSYEFRRLRNYRLSGNYTRFGRFESSGARFAVSVSDGAQSIFVESDTFCVPRLVPLFRTLDVDATEKQHLGIIFHDESVVLSVTGDSEMIEESMLFDWESNIDGFLGRSSSLLLSSANLSDRTHIITATGITYSENEVSVSAEILISRS